MVSSWTASCLSHVLLTTVGLIGHIAAVVVGIASPAVGDAAAVGALELSVCVAFCFDRRQETDMINSILTAWW